MILYRMNTPVLHFDDINGRPLVGGKLFFYEAGTSTPATTYRNAAGTEVHTNPVTLNERGECVVFLDETLLYKAVLKDSHDNVIWAQDGISVNGGGSEYDGDVSDATATFTKDEGDTSEISSGSTLKVLLTKISKFFAGLKKLAFMDSVSPTEVDSGTYDVDISGKSAYLKAVNSGPSGDFDLLTPGDNDKAAQYSINGDFTNGPKGEGSYSYWGVMLVMRRLTSKNIAYQVFIGSNGNFVIRYSTTWDSEQEKYVNWTAWSPITNAAESKLDIDGSNATAEGSREIVDKLSYNDDPTIDDNSKILQKNDVGWEQVDLSAYLEYLAGKHFPIMESAATTVSKTVASGKENAIILGSVNFPTRKTRSAIAIVTVEFKVDSNYGQIDLSQVSRDAVFSLEDTGSLYDVPMAIVKDGNNLKSCVTFQMPLSLAYYPSSLEAKVYFLNAPIGVSLRASVRITTLGTGQLYVSN